MSGERDDRELQFEVKRNLERGEGFWGNL